MAKRNVRPVSPKQDDSATAESMPMVEAVRPKTTRSHTSGDNPAEMANDSATAMEASPSEEDIRQRAYHRYLQRGGGHGMDFDDWLEAERELRKGQIDRVR